MTLIRGLDHLIADLDTRQRRGPASKNTPLQKYTSIQDTIGMETETQTVAVLATPFQWAPGASTSQDLVWNMSEWK